MTDGRLCIIQDNSSPWLTTIDCSIIEFHYVSVQLNGTLRKSTAISFISKHQLPSPFSYNVGHLIQSIMFFSFDFQVFTPMLRVP